jgi:hypothetical protein
MAVSRSNALHPRKYFPVSAHAHNKTIRGHAFAIRRHTHGGTPPSWSYNNTSIGMTTSHLVEDIFGAITDFVPQQANIFIPVLQINWKLTACGSENVGGSKR